MYGFDVLVGDKLDVIHLDITRLVVGLAPELLDPLQVALALGEEGAFPVKLSWPVARHRTTLVTEVEVVGAILRISNAYFVPILSGLLQADAADIRNIARPT